MPPTPVPNQIITAVKETVDSALQQQALGAIVMVSIAFALIAAAVFVYVLRRPAKSTGEKDVNLEGEKVKSALASMADKNASKAEKKEQELSDLQEQHNREMKELAGRANELAAAANTIAERAIVANEKFTTALEAVNLTNQQIAGTSQSTNADMGMVKTAVTQMASVGSAPLQGLVITASSIKDDTARIPTLQNTIEELCRQIELLIKNHADCKEATEAARNLERTVLEKVKRTTGLTPAVSATVTVPEQELKVEGLPTL